MPRDDPQSVIIVYVTYPSAEEAGEISAALIGERLAACANIMAAHRSMFRWEGEVRDVPETAVLYKTRAGLFDSLAARVSALHSHECPCILALPLAAGWGPFLEWVVEETSIP